MLRRQKLSGNQLGQSLRNPVVSYTQLKAYIERVQGRSVEAHGGEKKNLERLWCVFQVLSPQRTLQT